MQLIATHMQTQATATRQLRYAQRQEHIPESAHPASIGPPRIPHRDLLRLRQPAMPPPGTGQAHQASRAEVKALGHVAKTVDHAAKLLRQEAHPLRTCRQRSQHDVEQQRSGQNGQLTRGRLDFHEQIVEPITQHRKHTNRQQQHQHCQCRPRPSNQAGIWLCRQCLGQALRCRVIRQRDRPLLPGNIQECGGRRRCTPVVEKPDFNHCPGAVLASSIAAARQARRATTP